MSMKRPQVRIEYPPPGSHSQGTKVYIDDMEIGGLKNIEIRNPVGDDATVILTLICELIGQAHA